MNDWITTWGEYAGAISAIIALLTLVLWKPIREALKRRKARKAAKEKAAHDFQDKVLGELVGIKEIAQSTGEDVADLQCDRLNQAHDHWMRLGYCPTDSKRILSNMYRSYHGKKRNHLSEHYEQDIMDLPSEPPIGQSMKGESA